MTALVGMFCQDGVVIGADSAVTHAGPGGHTIERHAYRKIDIAGKTIIAGTGQTGLHQRFHRIAKDHLSPHTRKKKGGDEIPICRDLAGKALKDFSVTVWKPGQYAAVVAFPIGDRHVLCEYEAPHFLPDVKSQQNWFCSLGSSQAITDSMLAFFSDVFWAGSQPKLNDGILATTWTLDHAVAFNPGGVGGDVQIAVLERRKRSGNMVWQARRLTADDLSEHRQWVADARDGLRSHIGRLVSQDHTPPAPPSLPPSSV